MRLRDTGTGDKNGSSPKALIKSINRGHELRLIAALDLAQI